MQSSNATTMLVTSFVARDLVALAPALVMVLGADVGTALMARVLTFDLSPAIAAADIYRRYFFPSGVKQTRAGQLGRVGIGLGLILLALELIVRAVHPITRANGVRVIFRLADRRYHAGCADWRRVRHYQLLQPGGRAADRNVNWHRGDLFPGGAMPGHRR